MCAVHKRDRLRKDTNTQHQQEHLSNTPLRICIEPQWVLQDVSAYHRQKGSLVHAYGSMHVCVRVCTACAHVCMQAHACLRCAFHVYACIVGGCGRVSNAVHRKERNASFN